MPWDPAQYHKFQAERAAPFEDLVRLIRAREGLRVIDLGCGEGKLVREMLKHRTFEKVAGMDVSHRILEVAASLGDAAFHLRYDDYKDDPAQLRKLFDWLGFAFDEERIREVMATEYARMPDSPKPDSPKPQEDEQS